MCSIHLSVCSLYMIQPPSPTPTPTTPTLSPPRQHLHPCPMVPRGPSGYVGRGMLAAAAMGSVFASPPPSEMLAAIRAVAKNNPGESFTGGWL